MKSEELWIRADEQGRASTMYRNKRNILNRSQFAMQKCVDSKAELSIGGLNQNESNRLETAD